MNEWYYEAQSYNQDGEYDAMVDDLSDLIPDHDLVWLDSFYGIVTYRNGYREIIGTGDTPYKAYSDALLNID